tara:strand:+ start:1778 stop:2167 length:390 start_codon:yes stop_codon:yes gene_type:complete
MSFDDKERLEQREAEEDDIYAIFFGYKDIQPIVVTIAAHLRNVLTEKRYLDIVSKVEIEHDRLPKIALVIFAIWLCPELNLGENAQPRRFEPFVQGVQKMCMNILEGRLLSLQEFVGNTVTDYIVTPKV